MVYVFKNKKLYGYINNEDFYLFDGDKEILANHYWDELLDILPEGIDLKIMLNSYNIQNSKKELFTYLKNPIGDYYFSHSRVYNNEVALSDELNFTEPINKLNLDIKIGNLKLYPDDKISAKSGHIQQLSLSGYQHKLQVIIANGEVKEGYSNFILKPLNHDLPLLGLNEHLHTSFMREFGFEVPYNGIIYDEKEKDFHYIIKRFDINSDGSKTAQISLNALMKSKDKYEGTIDQISKFLKDRLSNKESLKFVGYVYANALLYNSDLHKKNISFTLQNGNLRLTPAYDVINLYPISSYSDNQTYLKIAGKNNKITIRDFDNIAKNLGINIDENRQNLEDIFKIYKEKYPLRIECLSKNFYKSQVENFTKKLMQSYEINLKNYRVKHLGSLLGKI